MSPGSATLCIIVPAFNESANIRPVIDDIRSHQSAAEVVVVNDCSTDDTGALALAAGVTVLGLPFNLGIGGAVQTGLKYALETGTDLTVQFDGDGQHLAEEINALLIPLQSDDADVVIGSRFGGRDSYTPPFLRKLGINLLKYTNRMLTGRTIADNTSGFRAYNRKALAFLADSYPQDYPEPQAVVELLKNGFRVVEVPVRMRERSGGLSSIGMLASVYYMIKVLLSNFIASSRRPVRKKD